MQLNQAGYQNPATCRVNLSDYAKAPTRTTIVANAQKHLMVGDDQQGWETWNQALTPYMVEPLEALISRAVNRVILAAGARTGKTTGLFAFMAYAVIADPGDFLIVHMTRETARDFSREKLQPIIDHSPALAARMSNAPHDDNVHDKHTVTRELIKIAWPTGSQLSGSEYRYRAITDCDRMPDNIDGQGDIYGLADKRGETYLSAAAMLAESSPGKVLLNPVWESDEHHQAPPVGGILGQYNLTDRRRWYWRCPGCGHAFEAAPGLVLFDLPELDVLMKQIRQDGIKTTASRYAVIVCKSCGLLLEPSQQRALNLAGLWVPANCRVNEHGEILGDPIKSSSRGYYLGGVAAAYQSWPRLLENAFSAYLSYYLSGNDEQVIRTETQDQAVPYIPMHMRGVVKGKDELVEQLAGSDYTMGTVPPGVVALVCSVDVQANSFHVLVEGYGANMECWLIDRHMIELAPARVDSSGQALPIKPYQYADDWLVLDDVLTASYPAGSGQRMTIALTAIDSGGKSGTSENAYLYARRIRALFRKNRTGPRLRVPRQVDKLQVKQHELMLIKGDGRKRPNRITVSWPDSRQRKGKKTSSRGDLPLFLLDSNALKSTVVDGLNAGADALVVRHYPSDLPLSHFEELYAEVLTDKGWQRIGDKPNEGLDLSCYCRACAIELGLEHLTESTQSPALQQLTYNSTPTRRAKRARFNQRLF